MNSVHIRPIDSCTYTSYWQLLLLRIKHAQKAVISENIKSLIFFYGFKTRLDKSYYEKQEFYTKRWGEISKEEEKERGVILIMK